MQKCNSPKDVKSEIKVKAMSIFDLAFDSDQRCDKAVTYLTLPLTWVKGKVKVIGTFDFTFDARQRFSQSYHIFDSSLTRVKGTVKVISIFDLAFDKNQMCNKSNFSCLEK